MKKYLEVGKINNTHGVRGELKLTLWCDDIEYLKQFKTLYFDDKGDLVIVFEKYDVAPGYMGCPEFVIPREVYQDGFLLSSTRLN